METKASQMEGGEETLLVPLDDPVVGYLTNGVHVGLKYKSADMKPFIYKIRPDKLCVFDVSKIDERLKVASRFIASYLPEEVLVVSNRIYGKKSAEQFAKAIGCKAFTKRWVSGTLTNPNIETFSEPKLLVVTDPTADQQSIKEAAEMGVAVVAICDSNTRIKNIDLVVPSNNKGKQSIALIYWVLAREVAKAHGKKFDMKFEDFVSQAEPQEYLIKAQEQLRLYNRKRKKSKRK